MEEILGQEQAFACATAYSKYNGISKRFYAACLIMGGLCADTNVKLNDRDIVDNVKLAYKVVDELLKQEVQ